MNLVAYILLLSLSALAGEPKLYERAEVNVGKRTIQLEERGGTLVITAPDYELSLRDQDGDNFYDEKVLRKGKLEMRFFQLEGNAFQNLELRERRDKGILRSIYFWKNGSFRLLEARLEPYKIYHQEQLPLGAAYQACRTEIEEYAKQSGLNWKDIVLALSESDMLAFLESQDFIDDSCNKGKFKGSGEFIRRAIASVLATHKSKGDDARYLGCLQNRRLGSLADNMIENILQGQDKLRIHCRDRRDDDETAGSFDSRRRVLYFHEAYDKSTTPEIAKKLFARTFFHETIHSCGVTSENHVHALENCCAEDRLSETTPHCKEADEISAREHRLVTFASSFSRHLPGFDDFWRELVSFKDAEAEKDIFDYFIVGAEKVFRTEQTKLQQCFTDTMKNIPADKTPDLNPCYENLYKNTLEQTSGMLDEVCEKYFDNTKLPQRMRSSVHDRCQGFQAKLAVMLKKGLEQDCQYASGMEYSSDKCLRVAMNEAMQRYSQAPDPSRTYEKMAAARDVDKMRYYNSLYAAMASATPNMASFRESLEKALREGYQGNERWSKEEREAKAKKFALEEQGLLIYRYLDMLGRSFPRSDAGSLSLECRSKSPLESRDCEKRRVERVTDMFFRFVCPSTVGVSEPERLCSDMRTSMQEVWKDVLDRCPFKDDAMKGYQCYQNVFSESVKLFAAPQGELPAFAHPFFNKENPSAEEQRMLADFRMTPTERAYLGALQWRLKGGKAFLEKSVTDAETTTAQKVILDFVRYLRSQEVGSFRADGDDGYGVGAYRVYESCNNDIHAASTNVDCEKIAIDRFRKQMQMYFEKICPVRHDGGDGDACSIIGGHMKELVEANLRRPACKEASADKESFACLASVYENAQSLAADSGRNRFQWPTPLRRSKDHMRDLIERLHGEDNGRPDINGDTGNPVVVRPGERPDARIPINFKDYDRMRNLALAAEEKSGPLAEMGRRAADEASRLGAREAQADDKIPKEGLEPGSQVIEGRRFFGSEASPWSAEKFEDHRSYDSSTAGNTRGNRAPAYVPDDSGYIVNTPRALAPPAAEPQPDSGTGSSRMPSVPNFGGVRPVGQGSMVGGSNAGGGGGGGGGGGAPAPAAAPRPGEKAKLNSTADLRGQAKTGAPASSFPAAGPQRGPATKERPVDASEVRLSRQEIVALARENPAEFRSRLRRDDFIALLKFHRLLVIVDDRSYGSLDSVTVLTYNKLKEGFEVMRLEDDA